MPARLAAQAGTAATGPEPYCSWDLAEPQLRSRDSYLTFSVVDPFEPPQEIEFRETNAVPAVTK